MTQKIRDNIAKVANILLEEFQVETPITNIDSVITAMLGEIEEVEGHCLEDAIQKSPKGMGFVIKLSKCQDLARRNFAIAQELGHAILHLGYLNDWENWDNFASMRNRIGITDQDFEAHEFAAAFLMPKQAYLDYVHAHNEGGKVDIQAMAEYFGVPDGEATNRGKWLGVLQWR